MFEVKNINITEFGNPERFLLKDISFNVKSGEILGISGLMGAGRTELVNSIFGDFKGKFSGDIFVEGNKVEIKAPLDAINRGIGLVTEDRKFNGLNLVASVESNITMASLHKYSKFGNLDVNRIVKDSGDIAKRIKVKTPSLETHVMNLSGGNQQKIVLAKWLMVAPRILIIDEPTRGIDVGAKYEIYVLMNELKKQGMTIIMISSELPEILGMSDRILVLCDGAVTGEFENKDLTEEKIMAAATRGVKA
jgi:D-xylose transport system ATP-binding protein